MLPQSHAAYTLATYEWLRRRWPRLPEIDPRWLALAAMGPDLIDKPLAALYFYRRYKSAVLFAHTLIVHLVLSIYLLRRRPAWWPYGLAFLGHAVLDRLWFFPDTFYWPLRGWRFHVWQKRGSEQDEIGRAYWYAFTRRPELWGWEAGGLAAGVWFLWRRRLYRPQRLWRGLRYGKIEEGA